ncbi:MAG: hypothetical protein ACN4G0_16840 [Polyangiales bacterium]
MLHLSSKIFLVAAVLLNVAACNIWDDTDLFDFDWGERSAALGDVPPRLALGATAYPSVHRAGASPNITSADPRVVTVHRVDGGGVKLTGVGVGSTSVILQHDGKKKDYPVEVAVAEQYEVWLAESGFWDRAPRPTVPMDGRAFLADVPQRFVVIYSDSDGTLYGTGAAELTWPLGASDCENDIIGPVDAHCVTLEPGLHLVEAAFNRDEHSLLLGALPEDDIVDLGVSRVAEEDAEPGHTIGVAAHGVSSDGTLVYGLHQEFEPPGGESETFAYELDPSAEPQQATVTALGLTHEFSYRGVYTEVPALWFSCELNWFSGC